MRGFTVASTRFHPLDLKPLLEIAKQRGIIKEEAGAYTLVRTVKHLT